MLDQSRKTNVTSSNADVSSSPQVSSDETKQLRLKNNFMISCSEIRLFYKPHKTLLNHGEVIFVKSETTFEKSIVSSWNVG